MPHRGASDQLHDDARPQQRQEADDRAHRQARLRDHPPADRRGTGAFSVSHLIIRSKMFLLRHTRTGCSSDSK